MCCGLLLPPTTAVELGSCTGRRCAVARCAGSPELCPWLDRGCTRTLRCMRQTCLKSTDPLERFDPQVLKARMGRYCANVISPPAAPAGGLRAARAADGHGCYGAGHRVHHADSAGLFRRRFTGAPLSAQMLQPKGTPHRQLVCAVFWRFSRPCLVPCFHMTIKQRGHPAHCSWAMSQISRSCLRRVHQDAGLALATSCPEMLSKRTV